MTIYALSTGSGLSGLAVIRVSGPDCKNVASKMISGKIPKPRVATLRNINKFSSNELIDKGIVLWFPGPASYTGEDLLEFHVHGSRAVIEAVQSSLSKIENCRVAEPGEFTKIAFENGKINLLETEGIGDLISSETEIQRRQALDIMSGYSGKIYKNWRNKLIKILSYVEAKIAFPSDPLQEHL